MNALEEQADNAKVRDLYWKPRGSDHPRVPTMPSTRQCCALRWHARPWVLSQRVPAPLAQVCVSRLRPFHACFVTHAHCLDGSPRPPHQRVTRGLGGL